MSAYLSFFQPVHGGASNEPNWGSSRAPPAGCCVLRIAFPTVQRGSRITDRPAARRPLTSARPP
jgi:hypothetical protein